MMSTVQLAFYKGRGNIVDRAIKWWTKGKYSHCEMIIGYTADGLAKCWSSSHQDGGVRFKEISLDKKNWDVFELSILEYDLQYAIEWYRKRNGKKYDLLGILGFVWRPAVDSKNKWFCSESLASALQITDSWRFDPSTLAAVLKKIGMKPVA